MEIIKSNKGSRKLLYEGYGYTKKYETKSSVRWECCKRIGFDCKGTLTTDLSVSAVKSSTEHSHAADTFATEAMKVRAEIKESAKANRGKPGQIVIDRLALQKKEVSVAAGPIRLLKQTVQRARKGVTPKNSSKMSKTIVQYVVVRKDLIKELKWPTGALIAQACHACTAAIHLFYQDEHTQAYLSELDRMHKVILEAPNEESLRRLSETLTSNSVDHKLWMEQPENIPTCVAAKPCPKEDIQIYFKDFKLFR